MQRRSLGDDADLLEVKESDGSHSDASMNFIKSVEKLMQWSDNQSSNSRDNST